MNMNCLSPGALRRFFTQLLLRLRFPDYAYYINGPETLPPPLTPAEEKEVFAALSRGEQAARDTLITHNLRLVVYIAKKFENTVISMEDIISIENALSDCEYEMDSLTGEKRHYDDLVGFSTFTVWLREVQTLSAVADGTGLGAEIAQAARTGLVGVTEGARAALLTVVALWPVVIAAAVVVVIVLRLRRRRKAKKAEENTPSEEEE